MNMFESCVNMCEKKWELFTCHYLPLMCDLVIVKKTFSVSVSHELLHLKLREKKGGPKGGYGDASGLDVLVMQSVFGHKKCAEALEILLSNPAEIVRMLDND